MLGLKIMIFRHGEAEERRPGIPDEERRLTEKGRKDIEAVAKILPWKPSRVYTSPLIRAIETAKIVSKIYNVEVVVTHILKPEITSIESIKSLNLVDGVVLVGHSPSIEVLISSLIGGGSIKLKTGAVAGIELDGVCIGCGHLVFLIIPDIMYTIQY